MGVLIVVFLTASIYVMLPDKVRINVMKTRTLFSVHDGNKFIPAAYEYTRIFDGSKLMRASSRTLSNYTDGNIFNLIRTSVFKDGIIATDFYSFDGDIDDVEQVPVIHQICFDNAKGKIFEYMIRDMDNSFYTDFEIISPFSFGMQMKVEFQEGYYRAKYYHYKTVDNKIKIRYRIEEDYQCFYVRLFDPILEQEAMEIKCDYGIEYWDETIDSFDDVEFNTIDNKTLQLVKRIRKVYNPIILRRNKSVCIKKYAEIYGKVLDFNKEKVDCVIDNEELLCVKLNDGAHLGKFTDCNYGKSCIKSSIVDNKTVIRYKNSDVEWQDSVKSIKGVTLE